MNIKRLTLSRPLRLSIQLTLATLLTLAGLVLLFLGFYIPPRGVIDQSVLLAFGEASTFAGALFGVDYTYRYRLHLIRTNRKEGAKT